MTDQAADFVGGKYTGRQDTAGLARLIRADLAAARDTGGLPAAAWFKVTAGDGQVTVRVYGVPLTAQVAAKVSGIGNDYNRITRPAYGDREAFYELRIEAGS